MTVICFKWSSVYKSIPLDILLSPAQNCYSKRHDQPNDLEMKNSASLSPLVLPAWSDRTICCAGDHVWRLGAATGHRPPRLSELSEILNYMQTNGSMTTNTEFISQKTTLSQSLVKFWRLTRSENITRPAIGGEQWAASQQLQRKLICVFNSVPILRNIFLNITYNNGISVFSPACDLANADFCIYYVMWGFLKPCKLQSF